MHCQCIRVDGFGKLSSEIALGKLLRKRNLPLNVHRCIFLAIFSGFQSISEVLDLILVSFLPLESLLLRNLQMRNVEGRRLNRATSRNICGESWFHPSLLFFFCFSSSVPSRAQRVSLVNLAFLFTAPGNKSQRSPLCKGRKKKSSLSRRESCNQSPMFIDASTLCQTEILVAMFDMSGRKARTV